MSECLICFGELEEKDKVSLNCKHGFHYECIYAAYKHATETKSLTRKNLRQCPYCREPGGYLPLKDDTIPQRYIHKEWKIFAKLVHDGELEKYKHFLDPHKCLAINTTGMNKDKQCKNKPKEGGYCLKHCIKKK